MLESATDSAEEIARRIHIVSAAARHYAPQHFQTIAAALMERQRLVIRYRARSNGTSSQREISPQRLTHYRDNWYLDAWCHLRDELRSFAVDAIFEAKTNDTLARDIPDTELAAALGEDGFRERFAAQPARMLISQGFIARHDDGGSAMGSFPLAVIGEDLQPTWRTGAVLGSLTIEQAHELAAVADRYAAGDPTTCAVINAATPAT